MEDSDSDGYVPQPYLFEPIKTYAASDNVSSEGSEDHDDPIPGQGDWYVFIPAHIVVTHY